MKIIKTSEIREHVIDPVIVKSNCSIYYYDGNKLHENKSIYCSHNFAKIIFEPLELFCIKYKYDMIHTGIYNNRQARTPDGKLLGRLSNHAYGNAIDFFAFLLIMLY